MLLVYSTLFPFMPLCMQLNAARRVCLPVVDKIHHWYTICGHVSEQVTNLAFSKVTKAEFNCNKRTQQRGQLGRFS